jgi:hypothetical protein
VKVAEEGRMNEDSPAIRDALRGASDGLLIAIREVDARERLKRGVPPDDPTFAGLAKEVRDAAETVLRLARVEADNAVAVQVEPGSSGLPTIEASPPPMNLAGILAEWRDVERRLAEAEPSSPAAHDLMEQFEALRDRYARAMESLRRKV